MNFSTLVAEARTSVLFLMVSNSRMEISVSCVDLACPPPESPDSQEGQMALFQSCYSLMAQLYKLLLDLLLSQYIEQSGYCQIGFWHLCSGKSFIL